MEEEKIKKSQYSKEVIDIEDMEEIADVSYNVASSIIRSIRSVSDTFGMNGKVHRQDYELWLAKRKGVPASDLKLKAEMKKMGY